MVPFIHGDIERIYHAVSHRETTVVVQHKRLSRGCQWKGDAEH